LGDRYFAVFLGIPAETLIPKESVSTKSSKSISRYKKDPVGASIGAFKEKARSYRTQSKRSGIAVGKKEAKESKLKSS
jgi:hypothetical protein